MNSLFVTIIFTLLTIALLGCGTKAMSWEQSQAIFGESLVKRYNPGILRANVHDKVGIPTSTFKRTESGWPPTMPPKVLNSIQYAETTFALFINRVDIYAVFSTDLENNQASMRPYDDLLFYDDLDKLVLVHRLER